MARIPPFSANAPSAKGLVGHWSLSDEDEVLGSELHTSANAASITNEANATTGWTNVGFTVFASSATYQKNGDYSMHFTANGNDGADITVSTTSGKRYRASLWYYGTNIDADTSAQAAFGISGGDTTYGGKSLDVNQTWTKVTVDFTASGATLYIRVREYSSGNDVDIY